MAALADVLARYLSDRFELPPGKVTPLEVRALLHERCRDQALAESVSAFLSACEAARYGASTSNRTAMGQTPVEILEWINQIERKAR